jgi:cell division septum initiation protein DivIVA
MDWDEIERLRIDGFTVARRGYDRREVDKFLAALLDWLETDAPRDLGGMAVKRKFELAGKSTAQILLTTENESEQMLRQTEEECADLRSQAEAASREVRRAADEHSAKVREKADEDARRTGEAASAKAKRVVEEGERRRAQIEAVIGELGARRDGALEELQRLQGELASTVDKHKSGARSRKRNDGEAAERTLATKPADPIAKP